MNSFLVKFIVLCLFVFSFHYQEVVYANVTEPWTVILADISAWIIQFFDNGVTSSGVEIYTSGPNSQNFGGVAISAGCNGLEAWLVLVAAIISFPAPWLYRLKGLIIGFFAIQIMNVIRVISLFYLGQWSKEIFDFAHYYAWQALLIIDAFIVFLIWLSKLEGSDNDDNNNDKKDTNFNDGFSLDLPDLTSNI